MNSKVADALKQHIAEIPEAERVATPCQGVGFQDFGDDSSDSGLESILWF